MTRAFKSPVTRPSNILENWSGQGDPAELNELAHETAAALLAHGADAPVSEVSPQWSEDAIDEVAELWEVSPPLSLPGAFWRLYVLRTTVIDNSAVVAEAIRLGALHNIEIDDSADLLSTEELVEFTTELFSGRFTGDFGVALTRAAELAQVGADGLRQLDDPRLPLGEEDSAQRAERFESLGYDLFRAAEQWRKGQLD